jgi:hypothetical protein
VVKDEEASEEEVIGMSSLLPTFEVRVLVRNDNGKKHYSIPVGGFINDEYENKDNVRMFHIEARNHHLAFDKAKKYGHPLSARKADKDRIRGNPENLKLDVIPDVLQFGNNKALVQDEMIWLKRNNRRKNMGKDRISY